MTRTMPIHLLLASFAVSVAMGCAKISGSAKDAGGTAALGAPDFKNTTAYASNVAPSDGQSTVQVVVYLRNSDNTPVVNYRPAYLLVSGAGVTGAECAPSDANGLSACKLTATVPGAKILELSNAKKGLRFGLTFRAPGGLERASLSAGALIRGQTTDGYKVRLAIGGSVQRYNSETTDGQYRLRFSTTGIGAK